MNLPEVEDHQQKQKQQKIQDSSFSLEEQNDNKIINIYGEEEEHNEKQQKNFSLKMYIKTNCVKIFFVTALFIGIAIVLGVTIFQKSNHLTFSENSVALSENFTTLSKNLTILSEKPAAPSLDGFHLVLSDDPAALCLDGSPGAYYISKKGDPQKFIISFMYGGWCGGLTMQSTLEECYQRSFNKYGTTANLKSETNFGGILSSESQNYFSNWTRIRFIYCDGAGHQGYRKDPVFYKGKNLYFRGHNITLSHFRSLQNNNRFFSEATHIVIQGQSAGGVAALMWTNYVVENSKKAKVFTISDSGLFLDVANTYTNQYQFKKKFQNLLIYSNSQIAPPLTQCVSNYNTAIENCMFAQNFYMNLKAPIFYIQSLYDQWSINNIIGISCASIDSLRVCSKSDKVNIQKYHQNTTDWLLNMVHNSSQKGGGMWAIGCVNHIFNDQYKYTNSFFRVPKNSKYSAAQAISNWLQSQGSNQTQIYQDTSNWPDNRPCSGL